MWAYPLNLNDCRYAINCVQPFVGFVKSTSVEIVKGICHLFIGIQMNQKSPYLTNMKSRIISVLFLLLSIPVFAQSKRKINVQLNQEFVFIQSEYDSIAALTTQKAKELLVKQSDFAVAKRRNYLRQQTNLDALILKKSSQLLGKQFDFEAGDRRSYQLQEPNPVYTLLSKKISPIEQTDFEESRLSNPWQGTNLMDALTKLEKRRNQLIRLEKDPEKLVNLNDLKAEIARFEEKLRTVELSKEMMEPQELVLIKDSTPVRKRSRKVQNEWLRREIARYLLAIEKNTAKLNEISNYSNTIDRLRPELDSLYLNYERVLYDLAVGEAILGDTIRKLREFSLKNWPKNFSPVFEREFGKPQRNEISQPTSDGWSTHVWYTYNEGPFIELEQDFIRYANPISINEFSVAAMKEQGQVNRCKPDPAIVYSYVDEPAEFPGGSSALMKYLGENYYVPEVLIELGMSLKLRMKFVVLEDGSLSDVTVYKGMGECPECDREAIRVFKNMPKWKPAKLKGRIVKSQYSLPINIHLN